MSDQRSPLVSVWVPRIVPPGLTSNSPQACPHRHRSVHPSMIARHGPRARLSEGRRSQPLQRLWTAVVADLIGLGQRSGRRGLDTEYSSPFVSKLSNPARNSSPVNRPSPMPCRNSGRSTTPVRVTSSQPLEHGGGFAIAAVQLPPTEQTKQRQQSLGE